KWEINFSAPFGAPFGYYDFRANITDSDGNYTGWLPLYNALLISNKNPEFLNVGLSKSKIYRNESVFLYSNCSDYETPEAELSYQAEYKHESDTEWKKLPSNYSEDHWESEFITYIDSELGFYYFRVKFEDSVDESTGWQLLEESLEVLNNPPRISYALNDLEIGMRAETINLTPFESDVEDTNENLIWSVDETKNYEHLKSVSIIDPLKDLLEIVPEMNVIGDVDIELTLTDKDGGTDIKSNITVHVDSTVTETTPKVTLLSPPDESIVNTLTPKLEWKLDNPGDDIITFSIFIDENPKPKTERISGLTKISYTLEDKLKDGKTYYWWVLPSWGVTLSDPFKFKIDLSFHIEHNVSLISERSYVSVKQGDSITVNLTVTNEGNVKDTFKIENSSIKLEPAISINKNNIQLDKSSSGMVELSINVPLDFELGEYIIYVKAISLGNNSRTDEVNITVEVLSRFFIPNYEVSLEITPTLIEIQQGKSKNITLLIENTGNVADEYYIEFKSDTFGTNVVRIIEDLVFIKPGFIKQVIVTITVPEDMEVTVYTIIFVVKSYKSIDDTELYVNVLKKSDDTNGNDGDEQPQDERENSIVYVGIAIIIIIIILIFLFLYIRKKREEEYLSSIEEEAVKEDKTKPDEKAPTTLPQKIPIAQPMKVDTGGLKPPQLEATPKVPAGVQPAQHVQPQAPTEKPSTTPTIIKSITTQQPPPHP
ncbi:MAG: hypothetical protein KAJ51_07100, partial [Thermoplasmata archaeon]|nr:hypothetical protein [Thermoplasmata archaeon]